MLQPTRRMGSVGSHAHTQGVGSPRSLVGSVTLPPRRQRLGVYFRSMSIILTGRMLSSVIWRMIRRKVVLILDRWSVHRAAVAVHKRYPDRLTIEWLPAYAPELNPAEQVWNHLSRSSQLHSRPHRDVADAVCMSITAQHHDNDLIRGFFKYAQLCKTSFIFAGLNKSTTLNRPSERLPISFPSSSICFSWRGVGTSSLA